MTPTKEIPLTRGYVALVDADDWETLSSHRWYACPASSGTIYAKRDTYVDGKRVVVWMHRVIAAAANGVEVDHVDRNGLNNRRSNLRLASRSENLMNRGPAASNGTGFKGVGRANAAVAETVVGAPRWRARIKPPSGPDLHLGCFASPEEAARAYDEAARRLYGSFAFLNFPAEQMEVSL